MFYIDLLQGTQSKTKVLKAVSYIGSSKVKFDKFILEFTNAEGRDLQKLAWIIGTIVDYCPHLIFPHVETLLIKLKDPCHDAVKRNVMRAIDKAPLHKDHIGLAADLAFKILDDRSEKVAVRVFCMSILLKICTLEPDLAPELVEILKYHMPHESAGFKSRASKIIKILNI
jgi:hypothetical protein